MDRSVVYPTEGIQDSHILYTNKHAMMGLGYLAQAILGTSTYVDGLACNPTSPASLSVTVGNGSIYSLQNVDATAYGTIAADTANQVVKQGIVLGNTTFTLTPPATSGKSQVYLVQATYQDQDAGTSSQPFVSSDGTQTFQTVNTVRKGVCVLNLKAGVIANTGSQVAPAPDAGYTALYAITVANGQTTITSPNIVADANIPTFTKLPNVLAAVANLYALKGVNSDISQLTAVTNIQSPAAQLALRNNTVINCVNLAGNAQVPVAAGAASQAVHLMQLGQLFSVISGSYFALKVPTWNGTTLVNYLVQGGVVGPIGSGSSVLVTLPSAFSAAPKLLLSTPAVDVDGVLGASTSVSNATVNPLTQLAVRNHGSTSYNVFWLAIGF